MTAKGMFTVFYCLRVRVRWKQTIRWMVPEYTHSLRVILALLGTSI